MTPAERDGVRENALLSLAGHRRGMPPGVECGCPDCLRDRAVLAFVPRGNVQAPDGYSVGSGESGSVRILAPTRRGRPPLACLLPCAAAERLAWALLAEVATARTHVPAPDKEG